jgi:hypothetical protein
MLWPGVFLFVCFAVFKYENRSDSVLVVNETDYENCHTSNPKKKLDAGEKFTFPSHGPFYFISGKKGNCENGLRMIVVVLSPPRNPHPSEPPESTTPSPSSPWAINPAILLVGSASLLLLILLITKKKKKKVNS